VGVITAGASTQPPVELPLPSLPPLDNAIALDSNMLTQPMDFEQILGNYTNASFNLDSAIFLDNASFGNLSGDAALLGTLKTRRIRTSSCHPASKTPASPGTRRRSQRRRQERLSV